ncbi:MAG TPA: HAMP domain-containing sensor histidine kinase, partial [Minicystis sp.]|nr:HAMP domain-containing sensor histidine kinase [Minicystis sp.]
MAQPLPRNPIEAPPTPEVREVARLRAEVARLEAELGAERRARAALEGQIARAAAERDDFLGAAAHDLKTPLAALKLQVQGLLHKGPARLEPAVVEARLRSMNRQIVHVTALLERLLEIARGDADAEAAAGPTDFADVVRDVLERYADDFTWARCPLTTSLPEGPVEGPWDRVRLDQVVTNLVSNALKYGRGAPVEVTLVADAKRAVLTVADHGVGIPEAERAFVFDKYRRAPWRGGVAPSTPVR